MAINSWTITLCLYLMAGILQTSLKEVTEAGNIHLAEKLLNPMWLLTWTAIIMTVVSILITLRWFRNASQ